MTHTPHRELLRYVRIHWLRWERVLASRWHTLVGVRWLRWQSAVSGLYYWRVTFPVQSWVALGSPAQFRPSLPWWQSLVWHYLHITGWSPVPRRRPSWAE